MCDLLNNTPEIRGIQRTVPIFDDFPTISPTGIEAEVCADIASRQAVGIRKYGVTLAENPADLLERLQHAYEECLDQACYLKWAMKVFNGTAHSHAPESPVARPDGETMP